MNKFLTRAAWAFMLVCAAIALLIAQAPVQQANGPWTMNLTQVLSAALSATNPLFTEVVDGAGHTLPAGDASARSIHVTPDSLPSIPAGSNLMGKVGIDQTTPGTTNGVAPGTTAVTTNAANRCPLVSAASTNATNCKASSGNVYGFRFINTTTTVYYLRLYNTSSSPTCSSATGFIESIPIPPAGASGAAGGIVAMEPFGEGYSTGISFCFTGGSSSTDNTNAATGIFGTILYQ